MTNEKNTKDLLKCPICGADVIPHTANQRKIYCSNKCAMKAADRRRCERLKAARRAANPILENKCEWCGVTFATDAKHPHRRFCSQLCQIHAWRKKHTAEPTKQAKPATLNSEVENRIRKLQYAIDNGSEAARIELWKMTKNNRQAQNIAKKVYESNHNCGARIFG